MADTLRFDLLARDQASGPVLNVGKAFDRTGRSAEKLNHTFSVVSAGTKGLQASFGTVAKGVGLAAAAFAGLKVGGFLKGAITQASDLNETLSKSRNVFGSSSAAVLAWSRQSAKAFGLSQNAALAATSQFGDMFHQLGFTQKQSAKTSENLVKMAADLGSFHNVDPSDVLERIGGALRGEYDSLQQLIPNISAARVQQEALKETHKKSVTALTAAEKATATLAIIQRDGSNAANDFAETSGGLANQLRILGAQFSDFKTSIGAVALPLITKLFTYLNDRAIPVLKAVAGNVTAFITGRVVPAFQGLVDLIVKGDFTGKLRKAFGWEEDAPVVGALTRIRDAAIKTTNYVKDTLVPNLVETFGTIKAKVEESLPKIDLSGIASTFTAQAQMWGGDIIAGVKTGLDSGDWSGLGETVGKGIVAAISGASKFVKDIAGKIDGLLQKVDWVGIGISVGKQVPSLMIGLAAGILNFDLMGLLKGLAAHWQEVLLAVLALALAPARIVGKLGEMLARIPFIGKLLEWGLLAMKGFADRMGRAVLDFVGFLGRSFLVGFRRIFPGIGAGFLTHLRNLPTYIGVVALEVIAKAKLLMKGLADTIARAIGSVVAKIGELIARMLRPFAGAAGWLIRRGIEFVSGLIRGVSGMIGSAVSAAGRVISSVVRPFGAAGRWLLGAGGDLIRGLLSGARSALSAVGQWAKEIGGRIVGAVKSFFGIHSPSTVFAGLGGHLISGLIKGMVAKNPAALVGKVFGGMTSALRTLFTKNLLGSITTLPGKALSALGDLVGSVVGNVTGPVVSGSNVAIGQMLAARYGWTGAQWDALRTLWQNESGWNNNAQNPTSTAYGIAQFLNSTWGSVGATKTSDPVGQISAGLRYIQGSYGSPINALSKWMSRSPHWYDQGGWLPPGLTMAVNGTGRHERVRTGAQEDALGRKLDRIADLLANLPIAQVDDRYIKRTLGYQQGRSGSNW